MNNNNSYLNVIKNLVNLNEINNTQDIYTKGFPVYVTSRIYPDCILKFTAPQTAKLIKRSELKEGYHNNTGILGKVGEIQNDYAKIDAFYKGSKYWIPVPEIKIKKELRRGLAFYKESGLPWTFEEYINCVRYSGEPLLYKEDDDDITFDNLHEKMTNYTEISYDKSMKYIYDDNSNCSTFMHWWSYNLDDSEFNEKISKRNILIYEEVFCDCKNIIWID